MSMDLKQKRQKRKHPTKKVNNEEYFDSNPNFKVGVFCTEYDLQHDSLIEIAKLAGILEDDDVQVVDGVTTVNYTEEKLQTVLKELFGFQILGKLGPYKLYSFPLESHIYARAWPRIRRLTWNVHQDQHQKVLTSCKNICH